MRFLSSAAVTVLAVAVQLMAYAMPASAHGDAPHPTCKKGYVVNDDHKCVKAPA